MWPSREYNCASNLSSISPRCNCSLRAVSKSAASMIMSVREWLKAGAPRWMNTSSTDPLNVSPDHASKKSHWDDIHQVGHRLRPGHNDARHRQHRGSQCDLQAICFMRHRLALDDLCFAHVRFQAHAPSERIQAFQLLQAGFENGLLPRHKCPDAMTPYDDSSLFRRESASRTVARLTRTPAHLSLRRQQSVIAREIASLYPREDFIHYCCAGNTLAYIRALKPAYKADGILPHIQGTLLHHASIRTVKESGKEYEIRR